MRRTPAGLLIPLLLVAPLLAGCLERGQPTVANTLAEDDDTFCRANNVVVGSPAYVACRKDRGAGAATPPRAPTRSSAFEAIFLQRWVLARCMVSRPYQTA